MSANEQERFDEENENFSDESDTPNTEMHDTDDAGMREHPESTPSEDPFDEEDFESDDAFDVEEIRAEAAKLAKENEEDEADTQTEIRTQEIESKFKELIDMLDNRHYADFRAEMEEVNPVDAADFFDELPPKRIPAVFKLLRKDTAADVFAELDVELQERIVTAMTDRELSVMLEDLAIDDAVDLVEELPANIVRRIMKNATSEIRADINKFLSYPEDSAGSLMTAEFLDLRAGMTCAEAIAHIRRTGLDKETIYVAYVTDAARVLEGVVGLRALMFADPEQKVRDIMSPDVICASTLDDRETVAQTISKYGMIALPIVDSELRLVGIVTVDDAIDDMETEATEDIEKMAAILPTHKPYLKTGVWETWKKRIPWLLLLMLSATFTSTILAHYENILDASTFLISLAVFVPMLTGTGGNASGQTSVTIIRGLSLGEIEMRDIFKVLWKEFRVSALCGVTVAAACFVKTMLVDFKLDFTYANVQETCIVCMTMFCAVVFAKIMGVLLPIGAKRIGFDPAVMASPFITTIVDTLTLLIYVGIASLVLSF